ncbi:hypothetical protein SAMN05216584_10296 [Selenomonas sp. WCT3]|uniref:hypothetical protein n=1 Tax=Selenomonas sp. WCT3 TaxID=3158785 RepID=UPI00087EDEC9|nr:hypothetical protein SAMN05216584_10296 [Selenomonas ruminantium]
MMKKELRYWLGIGMLATGLVVMPAAITGVPVEAAADQAQDTDNAAEQDNWYWLSADDRYSKFIDLQSVVAQPRKTATGEKGYETEVQAWTKTAYSYGGAEDTLRDYKLLKKFSDPSKLAFSTALISMNPQTRQCWYLEEYFYDKAGNVFWSEKRNPAERDNDKKGKEINSQSFDEAFYTAAIDRAFKGAGETARAKAKDRWYDIFEKKQPDGVRYTISADTSTMRMEKDNVIFWSWQETKDVNGKAVDVKHQKLAINLPESTIKVISGDHWTPQRGWQSMENELDGHYRMISENSAEHQMVEKLREYVTGHDDWVHRYERKYDRT